MLPLPELPPRLHDLLRSNLRRAIVACMLQQQGWFDQYDIVALMSKHNIKVSATYANRVARMLYVRGYAERQEERSARRPGRFVVQWRLIAERLIQPEA